MNTWQEKYEELRKDAEKMHKALTKIIESPNVITISQAVIIAKKALNRSE
jgi:hypothetical protein